MASGRVLRRAKRAVIGRPKETAHLEHERLGKVTALAVFASDNLSSSAYATEEILRVLVPVVGAVAFGLVTPLTVALLGVLAVLLFSYRQTIKAYPHAGGAYLVTKDNFGLLPAQIAGVALLTDYILTVSVSVSAGTAALVSAFPALFAFRVPIAIGFIAVVTWGNLRGVKESGRIFALPTYFFIAMMGVLLASGLFQLFTGTLHAVQTFELPKETKDAYLFLVLHAFASGGAAVTGVEAISNGVPAFRPPEWRNARTTLMWMGSILGVMFLGISILAAHLRTVPDPHEKVTILAQLGRAAFGDSPAGHVLFFMLQIATLLILVLAANTSYADFPRLASFLASDRFLPRQLMRYGDRLVFSNGVLALASLAAVLVVVFQASVTRLIPLYAVGVFTSFTFSQSGMAVRHVRLKESGWRRGFVINGAGAIVSGVMTLVIAGTKFKEGAWLIIITIPLVLLLLLRVHRHYLDAARRLRDPARRPPTDAPRQRMIMAVDDPGPDDAFAAAYASLVKPVEFRMVHFGSPDPALLEAWSSYAVADSIDIVPLTNGLSAGLRAFVRGVQRNVSPDDVVNVLIPETVSGRGARYYLFGRPVTQLLKAALLNEAGIAISNVTVHEALLDELPGEPPTWHIAVVLVSAAHNATFLALRYARSLKPDELHCVHVAMDRSEADRALNEWAAYAPGFPLEILESPYRELTEPIVERLRELTRRPRTVVTLVIPEFVVSKWWHNLLHNQAPLLLKRVLLFEPSVVVCSVPYRLEPEADSVANWQ